MATVQQIPDERHANACVACREAAAGLLVIAPRSLGGSAAFHACPTATSDEAVTETARDASLYRAMTDTVENGTYVGCCAPVLDLAEAIGCSLGEARASLGRLRRSGLVATYPCSHGVTVDGKPHFGLRYAVRGGAA